MSTFPRATTLVLALAAAFPLPLIAQITPTANELAPIVIKAPVMDTPLETRFAPRTPQQPLPANDGASLLKTIPGMSVIRKGGTDGDPLFRGMAASRLNILVDGEPILGGCGMRMDPPTAYIFPDAFDQVTLLKGPQTVLRGPGASAGTVLFERKPVYFEETGTSLKASVTGASAHRHDEYLDAQAGSPLGHVQAIVTHAQAGDYQDGDGRRVNAAYQRSSITALAGWTPDRHTRLELSAVQSQAEAAYADRSMDGAVFDRQQFGLKFEKRHMGGLIDQVEAQWQDSYVDHVMDNYSLRTPPANPAMRMASNPDRKTTGGRLAVTLRPDDQHRVVLGLDQQDNTHTVRSSDAQPRKEDARFGNLGLFGEVTHVIDDASRVVAGLRRDHWEATDARTTLSSAMMSLGANPTAGQQRNETLHSGFIRHEREYGPNLQTMIGLGHTQRAPDYWELISKEAPDSTSTFDRLNPEQTTQLDVGLTYKTASWQAYASGFYSQVQDYILIQTRVLKPSGMGTRSATVARNIDARTWGMEAGVHHAFDPQWKGQASLAWVRGSNRTDDLALAQLPPLEARLALDWEGGRWSAGGLLRLVSAQKHYALDQGNIVGQDVAPTGGFGVMSLHGGYRWREGVQLTAGVDNLFDKTYAESVSRAGALVSGYEQTTRVNEPGRTLWVKWQFALE